jgi:hypothetical protein
LDLHDHVLSCRGRGRITTTFDAVIATHATIIATLVAALAARHAPRSPRSPSRIVHTRCTPSPDACRAARHALA